MKALKKYIIAAAALPVILGSASAFAYNGPKDGRKPMMNDCQPGSSERLIMRQLNLSPEQRDEIRSIHRQERDQMRKEMRSLRAEEDKLLLSKDFSESQAMALAKKMSEERIQHRAHMLETKHKVLNVLTPEQRAKWSELRQQGVNAAEQCFPGKQGPRGRRADMGPQGPRGPMDAPQPPVNE
ncbi:Spy/CpxP family protein refolding chaperone [Vibrio salinus]|uniref:Spy/CpxP family protein refolding chaperone n=1 Tax=Vibrio salinus TaxID=2899784 RepID=UPI001E2A8BCD|nr:Spy/CpxP family protein refolding chaperone [Vibrio salinus]MCE0493911.1 Spy/CpxP family protein refolding chaperone [Vibrio salinus]